MLVGERQRRGPVDLRHILQRQAAGGRGEVEGFEERFDPVKGAVLVDRP